jgi:serine/threonine protein phosphatase PrpC
MLSSWLERGLGQILAPDETVAKQPPPVEAASSFWLMVAPDPEWEASVHGPSTTSSVVQLKCLPKKSAPPLSAFLSPSRVPTEVRCIHCQAMTPVHATTPSKESASASATTFPAVDIDKLKGTLNKKVLSAAKHTAFSLASPPNIVESRNKVFRLCASSNPLNDKLLQRLSKLLVKDKALLQARASHLGNLVPDGLTPLMASAFCNQLGAAQIIINMDASTKEDVDLQGRTALHIAAEMGSMEVVQLLHGPEGPDAPLDLTGYTPFGRALTSNVKAAQQAQIQLKQTLFSPGDKSVCGLFSPLKDRSNASSLQLAYGTADMPGFRVLMEDAISTHSWPGHLLLGVCDGHGDQGKVSDMVAKKIGKLVKEQSSELTPMNEQWNTVCLELDQQIKASGIKGGSTAVFSLITDTTIVVANVGDSRCILVQSAPVTLPELLSEPLMPETSAAEGTAETPEVLTPQGKQPALTINTEIVVVAMSEDHKPNLPQETARIEAAGLSVFAETFYADSETQETIYKVKRSEKERLAVSRAFGDFEYKSNSTLSAEEQAVCCLPELKVHQRDNDHDQYLILACDGVWDAMSNDEVGQFVVEQMDNATDAVDVLPRIADLLLNECLNRGSTDNMTCVIVALGESTAKAGVSGGLMKGKALTFQ